MKPPADALPRTLGSPPHAALPLALAEVFGINARIDSLGFFVASTVRGFLPNVNQTVADELVGKLAVDAEVGVNRAGKPVMVLIKLGGRTPYIRIPLAP